TQRKGKRVVDADERGRAVAEFAGKPFGKALARPIFAWTRWRRNLARRLGRRRCIHAQTLEATGRSLRTGIVDAEIAFKLRHGCSVRCEFGEGPSGSRLKA